MKFLLSLLVGVAFVGGLATAGIAGGDKYGTSASGTVSGSGAVSASPSTGGQDASKSGQDASKSGQDSMKSAGQDATKSGQDSGSASPQTGGQDKAGAAGTLAGPMTKDECMNDGWQNFGDRFKNQGDCVSSITSSSDKKQ